MATAVRYGNQKPRIDIFNDGDIDLAEKTIVLLEHYKMKLLPWQKSILRRWMPRPRTALGPTLIVAYPSHVRTVRPSFLLLALLVA